MLFLVFSKKHHLFSSRNITKYIFNIITIKTDSRIFLVIFIYLLLQKIFPKYHYLMISKIMVSHHKDPLQQKLFFFQNRSRKMHTQHLIVLMFLRYQNVHRVEEHILHHIEFRN